MSGNISVEGVEDTIVFLNDKNETIKKSISVALQECGILLKEEIQNSIEGNRAEPRSVDTGEFLNSITSQRESDTEVSVSSDVPQSIFMEFGTIYIPERRHFRNSADRLQGDIKNRIEEEIRDGIE